TAGYGLPASQAYPALLQTRINAVGLSYRVINAGMNADTSAKGVQRIEQYLDQPVDVLLLELGVNDLPRGILPEQTARNLQRIIDRVREVNPGCRLVVAGMEIPAAMVAPFVSGTLWAGPLMAAFRNLFQEVAGRNGAAYVPFLLQGVAGNAQLNQRDGIHPTAEGQQRLAHTVWEVLSALL
ncbi:MAG: arylesterase, partial [Ferruginibacter sp.]|nr:arylesterase [Cytophagales bacterium]